MSTDEKTGMQALERLHEPKPVRPGLVERVEFEYIRHGTLSLIAADRQLRRCDRQGGQPVDRTDPNGR
jgi:hypothetical protein